MIKVFMPRGGKREGAGRKPKYGEPVQQQTFFLPPDLIEAIAKESEATGKPKNEVAVRAIYHYLKHYFK